MCPISPLRTMNINPEPTKQVDRDTSVVEKTYYVWFTLEGWEASDQNPKPSMYPKVPWYTCKATSPKEAEDKAISYYVSFTPIENQQYAPAVTFHVWYTPGGFIASTEGLPKEDGHGGRTGPVRHILQSKRVT